MFDMWVWACVGMAQNYPNGLGWNASVPAFNFKLPAQCKQVPKIKISLENINLRRR